MSITDKYTSLMYKKLMGVPYSIPDGGVPKEVGNSRPFIQSNRIMKQTIPSSVLSPTSTSSGDFTQDTTFNISGAERWYHTTSNYINYYVNLPLKSKTQGLSYYDPYANLLTQTIPFNFDPDGSYHYTVKLNGVTILQDNILHPWILDPDAGFLTFLKPVKSSDDITISFFRYEGTFGVGGDGGTDARFDAYLFGVPPPATAMGTLRTTSSEVYVAWTNPVQLTVGFMNQPLPLINNTTIKYRIPSVSPSWIQAYYDTYNSSSRSIIVNQGSGTTQSGQSRTIGPTEYSNMILIYINSTLTFDLEIYFSNYAGDSTVTTINGLSFLSAGPPSVPTITSTTVTTTTASITATPGEFTDEPNNLIASNAGAPTLSSYIVQYQPQSAVQRYPSNEVFNTTLVTSSAITATSSTAATTSSLSGLFPDTRYNLQLKVTNSLNQTSGYSTPAITITTSAPSPSVPFLNGFITKPTTQYAAGGVSPVLYTGNDSNIVASGPLSIMTQTIRGSTANPVSTVTGYVVSANRATVSLAGFPAGTAGSISNNTSDITFLDVLTTTDQGADQTSGFFLKSGFSYRINSGLAARAAPYTLNLTQSFDGDSTTFTPSTPITFYVDSLLPGVYPSVASPPTITNGSSTTWVTGVPIIGGSWSLNVGDIMTNDVAYWFSASPVLTYSFAGAAATMINMITGTGDQQNNLPGSTITGTTASFYYKPTITLTLKNINNLTTAYNQQINTIINTTSVALANSMTSESSTKGHLMNSPELSGSSSSDWTTAHTAVNHSTTIVGTNNLQIMNGSFVTKSYAATSGSAYQDYTGLTGTLGPGLNYTSIGGDGYRWATFRWNASNGIPTSLQFTILGLSGVPITKNPTAPYLNNILVFYRIEDPSVDNGTPSNVANPANTNKYSTVWINANRLAQDFGKLYATTDDSTLLFGGLANGASNITISGSSISLNVLSPNQTGTPVYVYLSIGLPMNQNIAFSGASCAVN